MKSVYFVSDVDKPGSSVYTPGVRPVSILRCPGTHYFPAGESGTLRDPEKSIRSRVRTYIDIDWGSSSGSRDADSGFNQGKRVVKPGGRYLPVDLQNPFWWISRIETAHTPAMWWSTLINTHDD